MNIFCQSCINNIFILFRFESVCLNMCSMDREIFLIIYKLSNNNKKDENN